MKSYIQHNRLKIMDYSHRKEVLDITSDWERNHRKSLIDFLSPRQNFRLPPQQFSNEKTLQMSDIKIIDYNQSNFNTPKERFSMSSVSIDRKLRSFSKEIAKMSTKATKNQTKSKSYVLENRWSHVSQPKQENFNRTSTLLRIKQGSPFQYNLSKVQSTLEDF